MAVSLDILEGKKFCVVFVKVIDEKTQRVQLQCMRGRASVDRGRVSCVDDNGNAFQIPSISIRNILPSDGTALLKDAEYFVFVKLDESVQLVNKNPEDDFIIHSVDDDDDDDDGDDDHCSCGHDHDHDHHCSCGHDH